MSKIVIIGAGAAGLLAGIAATGAGANVTILEKMRKPGRKMLITGKGRCNLTNAADLAEIIKNIPGNGRFLQSALHRFTNNDIIYLLEENGCDYMQGYLYSKPISPKDYIQFLDKNN